MEKDYLKDLQAVWRGYTGDTTDEQARELFQARMGYPPETVWRPYPHLVLAGPIAGKEATHERL